MSNVNDNGVLESAGPRIKACVFDLDGTLLDTLPDLVILTNKALEMAGFPPRSKDEIQSFVGNGLRPLVHQAVPEGSDDRAIDEVVEYWQKLNPRYGVQLTEAFFGIDTLLNTLCAKGIKLAVLSNKYDESTKQVIAHFFPDTFAVVHGHCEDIPRKPDPKGLLTTIEELSVAPSEAVYIGDAPADALTAKRAGAYSVNVGWGYHTKEELCQAKADAIIDNPFELIDFLKNL